MGGVENSQRCCQAATDKAGNAREQRSQTERLQQLQANATVARTSKAAQNTETISDLSLDLEV
jgi:hypothetical protein